MTKTCRTALELAGEARKARRRKGREIVQKEEKKVQKQEKKVQKEKKRQRWWKNHFPFSP